MRTAWALMVMPRSRSRSMESSTWACISRAVREPVNSSIRSASVDLPWSMCAMMAKLRRKAASIEAVASSQLPVASKDRIENLFRQPTTALERLRLIFDFSRRTVLGCRHESRTVQFLCVPRDRSRSSRLKKLLTAKCAKKGRKAAQRIPHRFAVLFGRILPVVMEGRTMRKLIIAVLLMLACSAGLAGQTLSTPVRSFVEGGARRVALTHVRVIDGTGAAAREDQTVVISKGKIESVSDASANVPKDAQVIDLHG